MKPDQKGITWIAWKDVLADRKLGGLSINSLKAQNLSLLSKWWWRYKTSSNGLWRSVISGIHGQEGGIPSTNATQQRKIGGTWGAITGIHKSLSALNINLPSLFSHGCISIGGETFWKWSWLLENFGVFTSASLRFVIDSALLNNQLGFKTIWCPSLPSKVNIFLWKVQHHRLPTRSNIDERGIDLDSCLCPLCSSMVETEDHLFTRCDFSRLALRSLFNWWGITLPTIWSLDDIFGDAFLGLSGKKLSLFRAVLAVHFWFVWNARNVKVFQNKTEMWTSIPDRVQAQAFFWINSRRKKKATIQWSSWCCNPFNSL